MIRQFALAAALLAAWYPGGRLPAAEQSEIIPESTAARHGLTRSWFTQIQMDRSRARVQELVLHEGILYVQTDRATVHVIDAETGETLWAKQVGRPDHPSLTPAIESELLAVVNGSRLYVCNRHNGNLLYEVQIDGAPGAGACLSKHRAYIPTVSGRVLAYQLEPVKDLRDDPALLGEDLTPEQLAAAEQHRRERLRLEREFVRPLVCQTAGRALVQPLVTRDEPGAEYVAWPTDLGYLNIAWIDIQEEGRLVVKYRLETAAAITARPAYLPPDPNNPADPGTIFATSRDGFVHGIGERSGESLWRFSTGEPILEPAVVIGRRVYVATQFGGMYCLNAAGEPVWWTPQVYRFIAASNQRIYATDKVGRLRVLNAQTGAWLDTIDTRNLPIKLVNSDTDRLYLASDTGLLQCLHEQELVEPLQHRARTSAPAQEPEPEG